LASFAQAVCGTVHANRDGKTLNQVHAAHSLAALDEPPAGATTLRQALDCLRIGITLYDSSRRLIYANRHYFYLFRKFPGHDQLIGRSYDELVRLEVETGATRLPDGVSGLEAYAAARGLQLAEGNSTPRDIFLDDGRIIEVKIRHTPNGAIALWADVTRARENYGRLTNAVEMSTDAFAFWDSSDRLVLCNAGFAMIHGHAGEPTLQGVDYEELLTETLDRDLIALDESRAGFIARCLHTHHAPAGAMTMRLKTGQSFLLRERAMPDGGRASVFTDVTDRTRTEAAFAEQGQVLDRAHRTLARQNEYLAALARRLDDAERSAAEAKQTFLRTMSHELKTPLNAIIGFSDLLRTGAGRLTSPQITEYADLIHGAGNNLLTMLNQILDLTKIASGQFLLRRERLPVRAVLEHACESVWEAAQAKALDVTVECAEDLYITADHGALLNALGQALNNAVSFTQSGGTILLAAWREDGLVCLRIEDNGPGVAPEKVPSLTQAFKQVPITGAEHHGGAGLGLTLVKAIAEQHGGQLSLSSEPGKGFVTALRLPQG
jgi:signal transduction histidine kinase